MGVIFSGEQVDYLNVREIVRKLDIFREYAADLLERKNGDIGHEDHYSRDRMRSLNQLYGHGRFERHYAQLLYRDHGPLWRYHPVISYGRRSAQVFDRVLDWYMSAEWGLEDVIHDSLAKRSRSSQGIPVFNIYSRAEARGLSADHHPGEPELFRRI